MMQPITEDQEWTLRRWASTVGKRPRKRDKAFLQAEKGLSEQQIDAWWKNIDAGGDVAGPVDATQSTHNTSNTFIDQGSGQLTVETTRQHEGGPGGFLNDLQFSTLNDNVMNYLSPGLREGQVWSPFHLNQQNTSHLMPSPLDISTHNHSLSSMPCSQSDAQQNFPSSMAEWNPLLSDSCSQWGDRSNSDRSSYGSSLRSWDTASTLVSFCDLYTDDLTDTDFNLDTEKSIDPARLTRKAPRLKPQFPSTKPIPEEDFSYSEPTPASFTKPTSSRRERSKNHHVSENEALSRSTRTTGKYPCTSCQRGFNRKGDWERHEETQHDPQKYWTCMLGDPAIWETSWTCVFCDAIKSTRQDIVQHLLVVHKIQTCTNKSLAQRTFARKDKLKQHLQQVHNLSENSVGWEAWNHAPRKKWAWGCGFCGACSFTWAGRLNHIAEHYESQNLNISHWSHSLVIKGLLKQFPHDFNVSGPWKEIVGKALNSDRLLEWSKADADVLKRKLEFHEGNPKAVAIEARRLAMNPSQVGGDRTWGETDSRVATLTCPVTLPDSEGRAWPEDSNKETSHIVSLSATPAQIDVEMLEGMSNYI